MNELVKIKKEADSLMVENNIDKLNRTILVLSKLFDRVNKSYGTYSSIRFFNIDNVCMLDMDTTQEFEMFCNIPLEIEFSIIKYKGIVFLCQENDKPMNSNKFYRPSRVIIHLMSNKSTKIIKQIMKEVRKKYKVTVHKNVNERLKAKK